MTCLPPEILLEWRGAAMVVPLEVGLLSRRDSPPVLRAVACRLRSSCEEHLHESDDPGET